MNDGGRSSIRSDAVRQFASRAEARFGSELSHRICLHHRRRLRRVGWEWALDVEAAGWAAAEPPPRSGNAAEVLIDGAAALPRIAEALEEARSYVHLSGWFFTPGFSLLRGERPLVLRDLLARLSERVDVRVLAWAGAPLPLFRPSRAEVRNVRRAFIERAPRLRFELDAHERPLHCHHEKTIVIDGQVAFVGGIDLTSESGDRFDSSQHPARASVGWHDVAVRLAGPAVADVDDHFRLRWQAVSGERLAAAPRPPAAGGLELQVVRTIPERVYPAARRGEFGILESYLRALRGAHRLVYLENQFLWSPEIAAVLADKLANPPSPGFRMVLLLPARRNNGADAPVGCSAS